MCLCNFQSKCECYCRIPLVNTDLCRRLRDWDSNIYSIRLNSCATLCLRIANRMDLEMDVHSLEQALILRFVDGTQRQRKIVQLNGLNEHSDTASVARLVLNQCKPLVPPDRLSELERLIFYLQKRTIPDRGSCSLNGAEVFAKLDDLENYLELLYEEGEPKQRGVAMIAELVRHVDASRLAQIVENEQLMEALTRIWREDSRKNFELAIHLARLFHRLSQFAPFHPTLSHLKIGLLSVQMVDFELDRWATWRDKVREMEEEKERHKWEYAMRKQDQLIAVVLRILLNLADDLRAEHKMLRKGLWPLLFKCLGHNSSPQLIAVAVRFLWKLSQFAENQQQIANTAGAIDRLVSLLAPSPKNAVAEGGGVGGTPSASSPSSADFLCALLPLLFNCSFEPSSRRCMVNAGLVSLLAPHISENEVALALMYQLSIVDDAKAMIAFTDCIPVLLHSLLSDSRPPSNGGGHPKEEGTAQRAHRSLLVKSLLVNIVLEKRNAQLLCGSEGQGLDSLMAFALEDEDGDILAMKIARNIASHEGPTRDMFAKWVPQLLENAIEKVLPPSDPSNDSSGNIIQCVHKASAFALECMAICAQLPNADWTQLEQSHNVVAFLARILAETQKNDDQLVVDTAGRKGRADEAHATSTFGATKLNKDSDERTGKVTDAALLQAVQLCGTLGGHSLEMAKRVGMDLLPLIVSTLNKRRQEDDEIALQCVFVFLSLLAHGGEMAQQICASANDEGKQQRQQRENNRHRQRREQRLKSNRKSEADGEQTVIPLLLLNLMHDRSPQMRALCERTLEKVAKVNSYWRERIREARFCWHNGQWLEMVKTSAEAVRPSSAVADNLATMAIPSDHFSSTAFLTSNGEVKLLADGGLVLDLEQLLNGTEF